MSVIKYQQEVVTYKGRLEQQSITMLQQAKMSTLGEMAAGVAHEINNPLGIIVGKIEVWETRCVSQKQLEPRKLVHDFSRIKLVVQRISKLSALFALMPETLKMIPTYLAELKILFLKH